MRSRTAALRIPRFAAPVDGIVGHGVIVTFPPHCAILAQRHIGKYSIPFHGLHRIGIGIRSSSGSNAEETGLGVDRPESAVISHTQPGNIIADGMDLPAFHARRRHQHRHIGLAAGTRKRAAHIGDLAIRTFHADNKHMLGEPTFLLPQLAGDPQRQTLFRQGALPP